VEPLPPTSIDNGKTKITIFYNFNTKYEEIRWFVQEMYKKLNSNQERDTTAKIHCSTKSADSAGKFIVFWLFQLLKKAYGKIKLLQHTAVGLS